MKYTEGVKNAVLININITRNVAFNRVICSTIKICQMY